MIQQRAFAGALHPGAAGIIFEWKDEADNGGDPHPHMLHQKGTNQRNGSIQEQDEALFGHCPSCRVVATPPTYTPREGNAVAFESMMMLR